MSILIMIIWVALLGTSIYFIHLSIGNEILFITIFIICTVVTWFLTSTLNIFPIFNNGGITFLEEHISAGLLVWITPGLLICGLIATIEYIIEIIKERGR